MIEAAEQVFVVTPTLFSGLRWLMSDVDEALHEADARLDIVLGQLDASSTRVAGAAVGDDTPLTAVEDHVRSFDPDHILLALRSPEHGDWQEQGLVEEIDSRFGLPLSVFQIDRAGQVVDGPS